MGRIVKAWHEINYYLHMNPDKQKTTKIPPLEYWLRY
jgi:hypothetical protein